MKDQARHTGSRSDQTYVGEMRSAIEDRTGTNTAVRAGQRSQLHSSLEHYSRRRRLRALIPRPPSYRPAVIAPYHLQRVRERCPGGPHSIGPIHHPTPLTCRELDGGEISLQHGRLGGRRRRSSRRAAAADHGSNQSHERGQRRDVDQVPVEARGRRLAPPRERVGPEERGHVGRDAAVPEGVAALGRAALAGPAVLAAGAHVAAILRAEAVLRAARLPAVLAHVHHRRLRRGHEKHVERAHIVAARDLELVLPLIARRRQHGGAEVVVDEVDGVLVVHLKDEVRVSRLGHVAAVRPVGGEGVLLDNCRALHLRLRARAVGVVLAKLVLLSEVRLDGLLIVGGDGHRLLFRSGEGRELLLARPDLHPRVRVLEDAHAREEVRLDEALGRHDARPLLKLLGGVALLSHVEQQVARRVVLHLGRATARRRRRRRRDRDLDGDLWHAARRELLAALELELVGAGGAVGGQADRAEVVGLGARVVGVEHREPVPGVLVHATDGAAVVPHRAEVVLHLISLAQDAAAQLDLDPGLRRGLLGPAVHMLSEVGGALDTDVPLGLRRRGRERRRRQCQ
mmetsp:Transcript_26279/g.78386  ORF Transcript_26279/g.78386 Transcript_26279/m.78386 type:complete len:570 (+) Transcript_26279:79-1788(+)